MDAGQHRMIFMQVESAWSDEDPEPDSEEDASDHEDAACCKSNNCQHDSLRDHTHDSSAKRQKKELPSDFTNMTAYSTDTGMDASTQMTANQVEPDEAVNTDQAGLHASTSHTVHNADLRPCDSTNLQTGVVVDDGVDAAYIMAFLDRHVCPQELPTGISTEASLCGGTMAPCEPKSDVYECNMCGHTRHESQRIADLEEAYLAIQAEEG